MDVDAIICAICEKHEKDPTKVLECVQCYKSHHFRCKNILGNAIGKMKKRDYFCSADCQAMHYRNNGAKIAEERVVAEMQKIIGEIKELKVSNINMQDALKNTVIEIEKSQDYLANKFDTIMNDFGELKSNQISMKNDINDVQENCAELRETVENLEKEVDRLSRKALDKNAVVLGVPVKGNESPKSVFTAITKLLGCELPDDAVVDAKRLHEPKPNAKNPPMKVVFRNEEYKEAVFSKKREYGPMTVSALGGNYDGSGKIVIRDEMTSNGLALLREVKSAQEQLDVEFVWPGRDGVILIKKRQTSKIQKIRDISDLRKLLQSGTKRPMAFSVSDSSILSSSVIEPPAKRR